MYSILMLSQYSFITITSFEKKREIENLDSERFQADKPQRNATFSGS